MENLILLLLSTILIGSWIFYKKLMTRLAAIVTERKIAYESEKGKNIATKEDIEEITKRLESVRNEISFAKKRESEFIIERYNHLQLFLKHIHKVHSYCNLLLYYLYDIESKNRLITLLNETNDNVSDVDYELQMLHAYIDDDSINKLLDETVKRFTLYSCSIMTIMSNAIFHLSNYETMRDLAYSHGDDQKLMAIAIASKNGFENLKVNYKGGQSEESKEFSLYLERVTILIRDLFSKQYPNQYKKSEV